MEPLLLFSLLLRFSSGYSLLAPRLGGMFARAVIRAVGRPDMEVEVVSRDMVGTRAMEVVVAMAGMEGMRRLVCLSFVVGLPS